MEVQYFRDNKCVPQLEERDLIQIYYRRHHHWAVYISKEIVVLDSK